MTQHPPCPHCKAPMSFHLHENQRVSRRHLTLRLCCESCREQGCPTVDVVEPETVAAREGVR
jgi:hypothetical protein